MPINAPLIAVRRAHPPTPAWLGTGAQNPLREILPHGSLHTTIGPKGHVFTIRTRSDRGRNESASSNQAIIHPQLPDIIKTVPDGDGRLIADIRRATSHIESETMRRTMRTSWISIIAVEETRKRGRGRGSKLHDRDGKITEREGE